MHQPLLALLSPSQKKRGKEKEGMPTSFEGYCLSAAYIVSTHMMLLSGLVKTHTSLQRNLGNTFFAWFPNSIHLWFLFHLISSSFISFAYRSTVSKLGSWFSLSCPFLTHCPGDLIHLHSFPYHQHMDNFHPYESRPNISTELEFHITVLLLQSPHIL